MVIEDESYIINGSSRTTVYIYIPGEPIDTQISAQRGFDTQLGGVSCFHLFDCFLANRAKTGIRAVSGSHYGYASPSPVQTFGFNTSRVNDSSASFQLNAPCPRCLHGFPFQRLLTLTFGGHPLTFHGGCSFQAT
jgi:hypothetical protein